MDSISLKIIIIGAGIAGLSTAIALRRAGHDIEIFERSSFANEIGAAIHVCPNASRILLRWGFSPQRAQLDVAQSTFVARANDLQAIYQATFDHIEATYGAPWFLAHRADLHTELKRLATQEEGPGRPVRIRTSARVVSIDPVNASVTLFDASTHRADLIVAADGVHSLAVNLVTGSETPAVPTGMAAFRFLIPTQLILEDSEAAELVQEHDGRMRIFVGSQGRRLVWYPCRSGQLRNFVGIHPESAENKILEDWNIDSTLDKFLDEYKEFHPALLRICQKANGIKIWKLVYRSPIPSWYKSRLVLVGDAAHPMLPHQGQGGGQSIEDGAALGILLSHMKCADAADIEARLKLFESVRKDRGAAMQIFSNAGQDEGEKIREAARPYVNGHIPTNPAEFQEWTFSYDVMKDCEKILAQAGLG